MEGNNNHTTFTLRHGKVSLLLMGAISFILIFVVCSSAWGAAVATKKNRTGDEPSTSGFSTLVNCAGGSIPKTVEEYNGLKIPLNHVNGKRGEGKVAPEKHLATTADRTADGKISSDINKHLEVTNFKANCPSCETGSQSFEMGNGQGGVDLGSIPPGDEAWYMNTRWNKDGSDNLGSDSAGNRTRPKPGTKMIMYAEKSKRAVVLTAGYEWGPSVMTRLAGASQEAMSALGIDTDYEVTFGFAEDQSLTPGTVYGNCTPSTAAYASSDLGGSTGDFSPPFGIRSKSISTRTKPHPQSGIFGFPGDFSKNSGDAALDIQGTGPIYAAFDGKIVKTTTNHVSSTGGGVKSGGILWLASTDGNNGAVYAHITFASGIAENSTVKRGQKLGTVSLKCSESPGAQCTKLGPHLHFEFYINKKGLNTTEMRKLFGVN